MSIYFKTPTNLKSSKSTKEKRSKIISPKSKSNLKLRTMESKIIEGKKTKKTKVSINYLLSRIQDNKYISFINKIIIIN